MNREIFSRTEMLIGQEALNKLNNSTVAVFGIGGVGSYSAEALVRSGVGRLILIDSDEVSVSNINRQIIADTTTVGIKKVEAAKKRLEAINPDVKIIAIDEFITVESDLSFIDNADYVIDAIDTVSSKIHIIEYSKTKNLPIISAMGAGNKTDPTRFEVADIYKTSVCPLCKVIRYELRKRNIKNLKVVFSKEEPRTPKIIEKVGAKQVPGSLAFVPSAMGLIMAREVVFDIIGELVDDICAYGFDSFERRGASRIPKENKDRMLICEIERYYRMCKKLLIDNRAFLDAVVSELIDKRTLTGRDIARIKAEAHSQML